METEFTDLATLWGLRILFAAAILIGGLWLAFFISRFIRTEAVKHPRVDATLANFFSLVVRYGIILIVIIAVLQRFGVQTASLVAVLGASALAIGLALQGTLGNVASGIMIALMRPYRIGDFVELNGKEGKVVDVDLFFTRMETLDDRRVLVPNSQAVANPIINFSRRGKRVCRLVFGVGYDDDLDDVLAILREKMAGDPRALADPDPWFGVDALGDFAVNVVGRVWVKTDDYLDYRADMLKAVKEAFDAAGIEMPYPHSVELSKGEIERRSPPIKPGAATAAAGYR